MPPSTMNRRTYVAGLLPALFLLAGDAPTLAAGYDDMNKLQASLADLENKTATLGPARLTGTESLAGVQVPVLYFGSTKMNNFFGVVDAVTQENGGTATLFVRSEDHYVRVATNVMKADGTRAVGTILDPNGPAIKSIRLGNAYYGFADILGNKYLTVYEPIKDASGQLIGIYYVGYKQ